MPSITPSYTSSKSRKSSKLDDPKPFAPHSTSSDGREKLMVAPPLKTSNSRESSRSPKSSPNSPNPELPAETLKVIVGEKSRRSRCDPEFLEEIAKGGSFDVFEDLGRKFRIITGSDAINLYKMFLKGTTHIAEPKDDEAHVAKGLSPPVVFAVTVYDAGRKLVDYYMSWKGKTRVHDLRGSERKSDMLDKEFKKVARSLDKEFKRASIYGSSVAESAAPSINEVEAPAPTIPPSIIIPPPEAKVESSSKARSPASATDSVMSLPFLNMIRGVPVGNRVPLRVTNPDRLSMLSLATTNSPTTNSLPTVKEEPASVASTEDGHSTQVPHKSAFSVRRTRSEQAEPITKASSTSTTSTESIHSTHKIRKNSKESEANKSEFLIVLLDEKIDKNSRTWHGLERQSSRSSAKATPTRISPWDGPLARANGITYRTPPSRVVTTEPGQSSSEEEWENSPVIPLKPYVTALGPLPSNPPSYLQSPMMPAGMQYMMAQSPMMSLASLPHQSPYINTLNNSYLSSPYVPAYATSNMTPHTMTRPLSRNTYAGYPSPYVSMPVLPQH